MAKNEDGVHTDSGQKIHDAAVQQQWVAKLSGYCGDPTTADCWIKIGGETLPAHKLPLMACSPVFHAMFTNPLAEESKGGIVKIEDFKEPEAMRAVLHYCYQGFLNTGTMDRDGTVETFKLAGKYCIDDLKALLEKHFSKTLNVENVLSMAVLAVTHSAEKLKKACIQLIAEEGKVVYESAEWEELREVNPKFAVDLAVGAAVVLAERVATMRPYAWM